LAEDRESAEISLWAIRRKEETWLRLHFKVPLSKASESYRQ